MSQDNYSWTKEEALAWFGRTVQELGFDRVTPSKRYLPPGSFPERIEHTLLRCDATENEVKAVCTEAMQHRFRSVC